MATRNSLGIVVDVGELSAGLAGIYGTAQGLMGTQSIKRSVDIMAEGSIVKFGMLADQEAGTANSKIAHVYEYGEEGNATGRLWRAVWAKRGGDIIANITFRESEVTVPIPPVIAESAAERGKSLASHVFYDKAEVLETKKRITKRAGGSRYREGGGRSRYLVIERNGEPFFTKQHSYTNPHYNQFTEFFRQQIAALAVAGGESRAVKDTQDAAAYGVQQAQMAVNRARARSVPFIGKAITGFVMKDQGRPFAGFRYKGAESKRIANNVQRRLEKELKTRWRM